MKAAGTGQRRPALQPAPLLRRGGRQAGGQAVAPGAGLLFRGPTVEGSGLAPGAATAALPAHQIKTGRQGGGLSRPAKPHIRVRKQVQRSPARVAAYGSSECIYPAVSS